MRRVAANYVFPVSGPPLKNGILEFDSDGRIISVIDTQGNLKESSRLEYFNGILVPGFILPCCRIEPFIFHYEISTLPHLKKFISRKLGELNLSTEAEHRFNALDHYLKRSGIRGIGSITSRFHLFSNKSEGTRMYHSFIEIPAGKGKDPFESFHEAVEESMRGWNEFRLSSSIIPHNACTDEEILSLISEYSSFHDNSLLLQCPGTKSTYDSVMQKFGSILARLTGKQENQVIMDFRNPVMPVIDTLDGLPEKPDKNIFPVLQTDHPGWVKYQKTGIDRWDHISDNLLFSQHLLSFHDNNPFIKELLNLQNGIASLPFELLIRCFTLNPARALKTDHLAGSFSPGKIPGINLITPFDFDSFRLTEKSEVKVIA